ncbi:MAG: hypothetical protein WKF84_03670 [Pyrinomonadaceae bacterium]
MSVTARALLATGFQNHMAKPLYPEKTARSCAEPDEKGWQAEVIRARNRDLMSARVLPIKVSDNLADCRDHCQAAKLGF